jgi:hypothetical protein
LSASALITLHDQGHVSQQEGPGGVPQVTASAVLSWTLDISAQISSRFNNSVESIDLDALSVFVPHSLYKAALTKSRMWKETGEERYLQAYASLQVMLGHFKTRWLNSSICELS